MSSIKDLLQKSEQLERVAIQQASAKEQSDLLTAKKEVEVLASNFMVEVNRLSSIEEMIRLPIPYEKPYGWNLATGSMGGDISRLYLTVDGALKCIVQDSGTYYVTPTLSDYRRAKKSLVAMLEALEG